MYSLCLKTKTVVLSMFLILCINTSFALCANEQTKVNGNNEAKALLTKLNLSPQDSDSSELKDVLSKLDKLRFSDEQSDTYDKWNNYLVNRTHFNNNEYLTTILKLGHDYALSVKNLEECISLKHKKEKQYSDYWLEDLGKKYILNNRKSIEFILLGILCQRQSGECIESRKDAFYKESLYSSILHRYAKYFIDYVDTLNKGEQKQIKGKTDYAKSILEFPADPLKEMLVPATVSDAIQITALKSRKDIDPGLMEFILHHASFKELFDFNKALKDLREYK